MFRNAGQRRNQFTSKLRLFRVDRVAVVGVVCFVLAITLLGPVKVVHAAPFSVTTIADSGLGSLRKAITDSNLAAPGPNTITFNIPGPGVHTIALASPLPTITQPVTIDGTTQSGSSCGAAFNLLIEVKAGPGFGVAGDGFTFSAGSNGSSIKGLVINNFPFNGIALDNGGNNTVTCSFIGTDTTGTIARPNGTSSGRGIQISNSLNAVNQNNVIGGTTAAARNIISANKFEGIAIIGDAAGINNNVVEGNYIGTDVTGTLALGNSLAGVGLFGSGLGNVVSGNIIGGTTAGAGNVISSNGLSGVSIGCVACSNNQVEGNLIGVNVTGTAALGNAGNGIVIFGGSTNNTVGGTTSGARNVISGNPVGLQIFGVGTNNNIVDGNYIGTNINGTTAIPNTSQGIAIDSSAASNRVGGTTPGERNVISGNSSVGLEIFGAGTNNNIVSGNYIGTNANGTSPIPNTISGVAIDSGAASNRVGGTTSGERNVISGNSFAGVQISGSGTSNNVVVGNYIGTDSNGVSAIPNITSGGVEIDSGATGNRVGGITAGERNVISGNNFAGVNITGSGTNNNLVEGNYIGTDKTGLLALGNGAPVGPGCGIELGAQNNVIGGTAPGAGNLISANTGNGVFLRDPGTSNNVVIGNFIGTDVNGTGALGNPLSNVAIDLGASNNRIGGTTPAERNVISSSVTASGVNIHDPGTNGNIIQGNYIGLDRTGSAALGNALQGVSIFNNAQNTIVGGTASGAGNVISANTKNGVLIQDATTTGNIVQGNLIGTASDGTTARPNGANGVDIQNAVNNSIGDVMANARNVIAFNGGRGIDVEGTATGNALRGNQIYSNTNLGIDLNNDGVTPNDPLDADTGPNNLQNFPIISGVTASGTNYVISGTLNSTPSTTFAVDFYSNTVCDPSGNGQGASYLGSTTVSTDGSGNASFSSISVPAVPNQQVITSTATDPTGNTSEFSSCLTGPAIIFPVTSSPSTSPGPAQVTIPVDALTIQFTSSSQLVVTADEIVTLAATITNTSNSTVNNVSIRIQIADPFNYVTTTATVGTTQITCQLDSVQLGALPPGQQVKVTVQVRLDPAAPANFEADNVVAAEYSGGRLRTAGQKVSVLRSGVLPSTGYSPPPNTALPLPIILLLGTAGLIGAVVIRKRVTNWGIRRRL